MARFRSGRPIVLTHVYLDDSEAALTPAQVTATVGALGTDTPVVTQVAEQSGDVYTVSVGALPAGIYSVRWDGGATAIDTTWFEVADGQLFTVAYVRGKDRELTAQRFPAEDVTYYREVVEDEFERITGRSFIPVVRRLRIEMDGTDSAVLPVRDVRAVLALTGPSGAVDLSTLDVDPDGAISGLSELPMGAYVATVAYGFATPPADIQRVGLARLRSLLMAERSGIPDRATSFQPGDGGTYTLSTPGRGGSRTGIPDVDSALADYTYDIFNSVFGGIG